VRTPCERTAERDYWNRDEWSPDRATIAHFDGVAIGLLLIELTQSVEIMYSDKHQKYVQIAALDPLTRRRANES
jgi:hypothetical protein